MIPVTPTPAGPLSPPQHLDPEERWAIGIYSGPSPLRLSPAPGIRNPVLSHRDVSDADAHFVADPFTVRVDGTWHMFFEVLNAGTRKGEIGHAISDDGLRWQYRRRVLVEPFHLSYPLTFRWQGEIYMLPETLAAGCIRLYRAVSFPTDWRCVARWLEGSFADPTLFRHDGRWWLFACTDPEQHSELRLYHAEALAGPWQQHPKSPIVHRDTRRARPAGPVVARRGKLLRWAQDCGPRYGSAVVAFEITRLTPAEYQEQPIVGPAIPEASRRAWNRAALHHVDSHRLGDGRWLAAIDGHGPGWANNPRRAE